MRHTARQNSTTWERAACGVHLSNGVGKQGVGAIREKAKQQKIAVWSHTTTAPHLTKYVEAEGRRETMKNSWKNLSVSESYDSWHCFSKIKKADFKNCIS